ncbi:family 16 glycosylhydrolase [Sphingobium phenoxybenzoativorans]|uniref:Family 16 glycosylhydrolase n=1 Tax=Sphingobium phenoxybenzoativorans TaxID=1592790 RepID=A0A975Q181_9SPHN|nr:family 16 glycosylhydrolase [Sphingobium phenoxybenzoativorans]QUT05665.1 family 16 glycosylhydrolase [Sphingobium phenoxybenzoativorans]
MRAVRRCGFTLMCVFFAHPLAAKPPWTEQYRGMSLPELRSEPVHRIEFNQRDDLKDNRLHLKQHTDYGGSVFDEKNGPAYNVAQGALQITAYKTAQGKIRSGSVQSASDKQANKGARTAFNKDSFVMSGGYWEARIKWPNAVGTWGAFWLLSLDDPKSRGHLEIDAIEYYGKTDARGHHHAIHRWHEPGKKNVHRGDYTGMDAIKDGDWHTYGVDLRGIAKIDDTPAIVIYMDRKEVGRYPADPDFFTRPFYYVLTLAIQKGSSEKFEFPQTMMVDSISVWK